MIVSSPIVAINSTMLGEATQNNTAKPLYNTYRYAITVKGDFFLSLAGIYLCIAAGLVLDIILIIDEELVLCSIMTSLFMGFNVHNLLRMRL